MRVLMITGAGMSASSGLPTYRGEHGLYSKMEADHGMPIEELLSPQALADDPTKVWGHWRDLSVQIHTSAPTPTHRAMTPLSNYATFLSRAPLPGNKLRIGFWRGQGRSLREAAIH